MRENTDSNEKEMIKQNFESHLIHDDVDHSVVEAFSLKGDRLNWQT